MHVTKLPLSKLVKWTVSQLLYLLSLLTTKSSYIRKLSRDYYSQLYTTTGLQWTRSHMWLTYYFDSQLMLVISVIVHVLFIFSFILYFFSLSWSANEVRPLMKAIYTSRRHTQTHKKQCKIYESISTKIYYLNHMTVSDLSSYNII